MPKIYLDKQHIWAGDYYGPGEVEVPDAFAKALQPLQQQKQEEQQQAEVETEDKPPTKRK